MKTQQDEHNQCDQTQLQKKRVVYSHDINRNIVVFVEADDYI